MRNIQKAAKEYHLPEPEFIEMPETFRVNLFRRILSAEHQGNCKEALEKDQKNVGDVGENVGDVGENASNETKKRIIEMVRENNQISAALMADALSVTLRTVERNIRELREEGVLVRHGAARGGYWEIAK